MVSVAGWTMGGMLSLTRLKQTEEYPTSSHLLPVLRETHALDCQQVGPNRPEGEHTTRIAPHAITILPRNRVGPSFLVMTVIGGWKIT